MTDSFMERGPLDTEPRGRRPRGDEGRDRGDAPTHQGTPRTAGEPPGARRRARGRLPLRATEGAKPAGTAVAAVVAAPGAAHPGGSRPRLRARCQLADSGPVAASQDRQWTPKLNRGPMDVCLVFTKPNPAILYALLYP